MINNKNIMKLCFHLGHVRQKLIDLQNFMENIKTDDPYTLNQIAYIHVDLEEIESEINIEDIIEILTEGKEDE